MAISFKTEVPNRWDLGGVVSSPRCTLLPWVGRAQKQEQLKKGEMVCIELSHVGKLDGHLLASAEISMAKGSCHYFIYSINIC